MGDGRDNVHDEFGPHEVQGAPRVPLLAKVVNLKGWGGVREETVA